VTGVGERIVMAGGGTSWWDMALYLIARHVGLKEARQVARTYMLDRIGEAKQMLETGDAPVEAIAADIGYQDASFFGRLFRRHVGMTPAHYRRRFSSLRRALEKRCPFLRPAGPAPNGKFSNNSNDLHTSDQRRYGFSKSGLTGRSSGIMAPPAKAR
jgi:hypothetical protein